jgi:parallel beta-helix repeat protein
LPDAKESALGILVSVIALGVLVNFLSTSPMFGAGSGSSFSFVVSREGDIYYAKCEDDGWSSSGINCTYVVQSALSHLPTGEAYYSGVGGNLFFKPALYQYDVPLEITYDLYGNGRFTFTSASAMGCTFRGSGNNSIVEIKAHNATSSSIVEGIIFSNIFFDGGQHTGEVANVPSILIENSGWITIDHCYFFYAPDDCIYIHNPRGFIRVRDCTIWGGYGSGIHAWGDYLCEEWWIENNEFISNADYGVWLVSCHAVSISGNHVTGAGKQGLYLYACDDCRVYDNGVIGNGRDGMHLSTCGNCTVFGNVCQDNGNSGETYFDGIHLGDCVGIAVSGNTCVDYHNDGGGMYEQQYGIHGVDCVGLAVVGNSCLGNKDSSYDVFLDSCTDSEMDLNCGREGSS